MSYTHRTVGLRSQHHEQTLIRRVIRKICPVRPLARVSCHYYESRELRVLLSYIVCLYHHTHAPPTTLSYCNDDQLKQLKY